jgi:lambda repressor-like predicted transcriptional regulator
MESCEVCGRALPYREPGRPGRPRLYHDPCKKIVDALTLLHAAIRDGDIRWTTPAAREKRAELWGLANDIKPWVDTSARVEAGAAVRARRIGRGWSLRELSERSGVPVSTLSKMELGQSPMNKAQRAAVDAALSSPQAQIELLG